MLKLDNLILGEYWEGLEVRWTVAKGQQFKVPSYIVRIDSPNHTHGWQIRFPEQSTVFVSDSQFDDNPRISLEAAKEKLKPLLNGFNLPNRMLEKKPKNYDSVFNGFVGLGISAMKTPGYDFRKYTLITVVPVWRQKNKRFRCYIGTENTMNQQRINRALIYCVAGRLMGVDMYRNCQNTHQLATNLYKVKAVEDWIPKAMEEINRYQIKLTLDLILK